MNILITGGSGFIGQHIAHAYAAEGHAVTLLSRSERKSDSRYISWRAWNGREMPPAIGLYDVIINLAGAGITDEAWTEARKKEILESRLLATRACVEYINRSTRKPSVFISASAIGYYGVENPAELDETAPAGSDFLAEVCRQWEAAAAGAKCRTVIARIGIVLGKEGGALPQLKSIYKKWLGGRLGSGQQGFSWIHIDDLVGAIRFAALNDSLQDPINLVSPQPLSQSKFSEALASAMHVMDLAFAPKWLLNRIFGKRGIMLWGGQFVRPQRLLDAGYSFRHPELKAALKGLV